MPSITDWLMVVITAVYVIATIEICRANISVANATRDQLAESKRQFKETQRISVMPEFQAEIKHRSYEHKEIPTIQFILSSPKDNHKIFCSTEFIFALKNVGFGAAKEIRYAWIGPAGRRDRGDYPLKAVFPNDCGETLVVAGFFPEEIEPLEPIMSVPIFLYYKDLLDNSYEQEIKLIFYIYYDEFHREKSRLEISECITNPSVLKKEQQNKETAHV